MSKKNKKDNTEIINTVNGIMTFGKTDNGQNILDFMCIECAEITPFIADCKVQAMRDGNVYITEKPKRIHNHPIFREDNSTLTMGRDGLVYFYFSLPQEKMAELPDKLVHQALAIAQKVEHMLAEKKGGAK